MNIVVIGSGLGGLSAGAFLAKAGHVVTVLEKHYRIGGYAHNFKRKSFVFESGIHTVPFRDNGVLRGLLEQLDVSDQIETAEYPEMFRYLSPEGEFIMPANKDEAKAYLYKTFPHEKKGLDRFFEDLELLNKNMLTLFTPDKRGYRDENHEFMKRFKGRSYEDYLREIFTDETIYNLFSSQWPFVGITPDSGSNLFLQMLFATHYFDGSFTVKGGFAKVADALKSVIEANGGAVHIRNEVTGILTDGKVATGVVTKKGDTFPCDMLVSNISPDIVHNTLLPEESRSKRWQKRINNLNGSLSSVIVYLGMKESYREKVDGQVILWYRDQDQKKVYDRVMNNEMYNGDHMLILNSLESIEGPTLMVMTMAKQSACDNWKEQKMIDAELILENLEKLYPGIRDDIEFMDVGSPDTFERFSSNRGGAIYGFENTSEMYGSGKILPLTHMKNMYQTGHWGIPGCGVFNVVTNGYTVAKEMLEAIVEEA